MKCQNFSGHIYIESLNKCSIDHSKRAKTLEACLEFTYRQDKKTTLEHLYAFSGLPVSFKRFTLEKCKQRQNLARGKLTKEKKTQLLDDDDDVGLKGMHNTCMQTLTQQ